MSSDLRPPREVIDYYDRYAEERRLQQGEARLEFERTKTILGAVLPHPPAVVIDVGGAAGAYSFWLAGRGFTVHLVDASERLVAEAVRRNVEAPAKLASTTLGDARSLPHPDGCADAVLLMGPLYHLLQEEDRMASLREARRVVKPAGIVVAAAISRYASALDGMRRRFALDPVFRRIRDRDLADGQHRPRGETGEYFTTAYFHRPEDLASEMRHAGLDAVSVYGVEGPGWLLQDFDEQWQDEALRGDLLEVARTLQCEPSIVGASAHLLGVGRRPAHREIR